VNQTSILLGDYLFAAAFGALAANGNNAFMSELMDVVARMCEGQVRFLRARGSFLSTPEYLDLLRRKSGSLADFCARAGGQTAGGSAELSEALGAFGERFGVAFHLAGEILDLVEGDGSVIARVLGPDRGFTLPLALTAQAGQDERAALVAITGKTELSSEDLKEVRRLAEASGALYQCRGIVDSWLQEALDQLAPIPETDAKRLLERIAVDLCASGVNRFGS
jgi:geranylgeranyl pyrophosphate synthase